MQASQKLKDYIKSTEQFRSKAYRDGFINGKQQYSIGYGHQIQPNEIALLTKVITQAEGDLMFDADFKQYENAVNAISNKRPLNQNQFDALCDFAFNAGTGSVAKVGTTWVATASVADTVSHLQEYNKKHISPTQIVVAPELVKRRQDEANLFQGYADFTQKKNGGS